MKPEAQNDSEQKGFYELFGIKSSYIEVQIAARLLKGLIQNPSFSYHDGEVSGVSFKVDSNEDINQIEELLTSIKVYPWITEQEDGSATVEIDNHREIERLQFFGVLGDAVAPTEKMSDEIVSEFVDEYAFPLPPTPPSAPQPRNTESRAKIDKPADIDEDPLAVDTWMSQTTDSFDEGGEADVAEVEKEVRPQFGPNLKLYKREYFFRDGSFYKKSGEVISPDEHKEILLAAKHDPEKMDQAVRMSVGLVKTVVDRIMKKFSTNEVFDEDDLFQAGMEGLLYGLSNLKDMGLKPSSYLVPCIEGSVRSVIRTKKRAFDIPSGMADKIAKYRRKEAELRRFDAGFTHLSAEKQRERVAEELHMPLYEIRAMRSVLVNGREEFDEEKIEPDPYEKPEQEKAAEHLELAEDLSERLELQSLRGEIVLRLRFGILGGTRFKDKEVWKKLREESKVAGDNFEKNASILKLYDFDLETDEYDSYGPAERMFLALIGKIPESFVDDIRHGRKIPGHEGVVSFDEVGELLGVSRERIRQIEVKTIRHLKHPSQSRKLRQHLDY